MNAIPETILKSICVAIVSFWSIVISDLPHFNLLNFILSIFPISIITSLTILITIFPYTRIEPKKQSKTEVFKRHFPFYAMFAFKISTISIFYFQFNVFVCACFTSAFVSLCMAWVWLFKPKKYHD